MNKIIVVMSLVLISALTLPSFAEPCPPWTSSDPTVPCPPGTTPHPPPPPKIALTATYLSAVYNPTSVPVLMLAQTGTDPMPPDSYDWWDTPWNEDAFQGTWQQFVEQYGWLAGIGLTFI